MPLTKLHDTDRYLLQFLTFNCLLRLARVNNSIYDFAKTITIYRQVMILKYGSNRYNRTLYCIEQGFNKLFERMYFNFYTKDLSAEGKHKDLIHAAARYGRIEIMVFLIINMDFELEEEDIIYALDFATDNNHLNIVRFLFKYTHLTDGTRALFTACNNNYTEMVFYLLEYTKIKLHKFNFIKIASGKGYLEIVRYLLSTEKYCEDDDNIALRAAAENGHLEIVQCLCENDADITYDNNNAIIYASKNGHFDVVKYLVENDADITAQNNLALQWAFKNGHQKIVDYLISVGADIASRYNKVVCESIVTGNMKDLQKFVSLGADITFDNNRAIHIALENNMFEMVDYLISLGANLSNINEILLSACKEGNLQQIRYLTDTFGAKNDETILIAARHGYTEIVKYLAGHYEIDFDFLLCETIHYGHYDIVCFLVENGANVIDNNRPLNITSKKANIPIMRYLIDNGADLTVNNNMCLISAVKKSNLEMVKYLVSKGADVSACDDLLIMVSRSGNFPLARFLVENGAKITNKAVKEGARTGQYTMSEYLITNIVGDIEKRLALNEAIIDARSDVKKYLIQFGVDNNLYQDSIV